jgi:hypothetical protein
MSYIICVLYHTSMHQRCITIYISGVEREISEESDHPDHQVVNLRRFPPRLLVPGSD